MRWRSVFGALALVACSDEAVEPVTTRLTAEPLARVTLEWTISGSGEPIACATASAAVVDVSIRSPESGGELEAFQEPCTSFATKLILAPGTYSARVRLLDTVGRPRTPVAEVAPFTLEGDALLLETVDFAVFL